MPGDLRIVHRVMQRIGQGRRSHAGFAEQRGVATASQADLADAVDDGDLGRAARGIGQAGDIVGEIDGAGIITGPAECGALDLVPIAQAIQKACRLGRLAAIGPAGHELPGLGRRDMPAAGKGVGQLRRQGIDEALHIGPLRGRHAGLGQAVHRALVFLAMVHARGHPDLVEEIPEEGRLQHGAGEGQAAGGLHPDLAGRRRQDIAAVGLSAFVEAFGEGDHRLAGAPEAGDLVGKLLGMDEIDPGIAQA